MSDIEKTHPIRLMIIGAQKAGTTSLLQYLSQHPKICKHDSPELTYFMRESEYRNGYANMYRRNYSCQVNEDSTVLVAKNIGVLISEDAQVRLHNHNPDVQVVILLRNPIDRAYSSYWYAKRRGWETMASFEEALSADPLRLEANRAMMMNCNYLDSSLYIKHIRLLLDHFRMEQVQFFLLEDLKEDPVAVCMSLYELFDSINNSFEPETFHTYNPSANYRFRSLALLTSSRTTLPTIRKLGRKLIPDSTMDYMRDKIRNANEQDFTPPPLDPETRARLLAYYKPYNQQLSQLIGRDLDNWNE